MDITENFRIYFFMLILSPLIGFLLNLVFFKKNPTIGCRLATFGVWVGFMNACATWIMGWPFSQNNQSWWFIANELSWLMATLILFVSAIVHHFSLRYMEGDRKYHSYFLFLTLITICALFMVASDHMIMFIMFWCFCNTILVWLMMHKFQWLAAKNSGILAIKIFGLGLIFLSAGTGLLAYESGTFSLSLISERSESLPATIRFTALLLVILASFTQSGCFPFHSWLISSLNSPTPVSAFMHAGLINGGGLLLARFAPVFLHEGRLLNLLFVLALISLILGGIWKLMQSDVKRMLACSTMTQLGFMMMQCGLGLFPAALAHLFLHGLFKAFLFLRSGSTIGEHLRNDEERVSTIPTFFLSSLCGIMGACGFILGSGLTFGAKDTTLVLIFFSWVASTQIAHALLQKKQSIFAFLLTGVFCLFTGLIYGLTVHLIEVTIASLRISQPQALNFFHIAGMALIFCIWIAINLNPFKAVERSLWWKRFYVKILNASQPDLKTTTSSRNGYKF